MKHLLKQTKLLLLLVLAISLPGCNDDDDATLPQVVAGFTHTINQETGMVRFLNTSSNASSYTWDFGDDTNSSENNPTKIYESGTYKVILTASNVAGAKGYFEDTIVIAIPEAVTVPITFDAELVQYDSATVFNGTSFSVVPNPDTSGSNTEASNVGQITNSGANFEGLYFDLGAPLNLATQQSITMNFWSDTPVDILVKLEQGTGADVETSASHGGTGWEELAFTFDSTASYNRFTMFVDAFGTATGTYYIDDIMQVDTIDLIAPVITLNGDATMDVFIGDAFTDPGASAQDNTDGDISANITVGGDTVDTATLGTYVITYNVSDAAGNAADEVTRTVNVIEVPTAPTTSAPVPPARNAEDVISIYGEAYTNIAVANYDPNWGQPGHMLVNTTYNPGDGNLVLAYPNFTYQGTDFGAGGPANATAMEFLHVDIWVASGTSRQVKVSPISPGGAAAEYLVEVPVTPGSWNSVDIPLTDFTSNGMVLDNIIQMKFDGQFNADGSANTTPFDVYIDNLYFYKAPTVVVEPSLPFDFEDGNLPFIAFDGGANAVNVANPDTNGNSSTRVAQFNKVDGSAWYSGMIFDQDTRTTPLIDLANGTTFTVKVWSPNAGVTIRMGLEDVIEGEGNPSFYVNQTLDTANQWVTMTFDFASQVNASHTYKRIVLFPDFDDTNQVPVSPGATYYFDDIAQQ